MQDAPEAEISRCHLAYVKMTGLELPLKSICDSRIRAWSDWLRGGYTVHDLETVILWLKNQIRTGDRNPGCLRFGNLIEDRNRFEDELAFAKAEMRNAKPAPSDKEKVQQSFSPVVCEITAPTFGAIKQPKEVIRNLIAQMRQEAK